jgi:hypothetical protein
MKAVLLNGALLGTTGMDAAHSAIVDELTGRGWGVQPFILHEMNIGDCLGCFGCWMRTPGECVQDDGGREVARAVVQSDLVVLLTPITFGGYSSTLKKAVDRLLPNILPFFTKVQGETHHPGRYERYPNVLVIGVLPQPDGESEAIFRKMVDRNAINMRPDACACGIVLEGQTEEALGAELRPLIDAVEVI